MDPDSKKSKVGGGRIELTGEKSGHWLASSWYERIIVNLFRCENGTAVMLF